MIIRSPRSRNYTLLGNEIFDSGMSLEAIGLLAYLLSRPDDWHVLPAQLAAKFGGRDRTYRILKEIEAAGYMVRQRLSGGGMKYTVFDSVQVSPSEPLPENPDLPLPSFPDGPLTEKPDPEKPDALLRTESNQLLTCSSDSKSRRALASGWPVDAFGQFWALYPHKIGKADARKAFERAQKKAVLWSDLMAGLHRYVAKTDDRPWCNPATWLNQERWSDQPAPPVAAARGQGGAPRDVPSFFDIASGGYRGK